MHSYTTPWRLFCYLLPLLTATVANAQVQQQEAELYAHEKHRITARLVVEALQRYHYSTVQVDDRLSATTLDNYLDRLDGNRIFFVGSDIQDFSTRYRFQLDDALANAILDPAFVIFHSYRRRVAERITHAMLVLEQSHDYTISEEYRFDRSAIPWAGSVEQLNESWRRRIKNDLLSLKLTGKSDAEARDVLRKRYRNLQTSAWMLNSDDVFQLFINAFTTAIEPHTTYFSPRSSENFDISMQLSLEGIGAVLRNENSEYTVVQRLIPGGPAALSNTIKAEDRIIGVGQGTTGQIIDVIGWRLDSVVDLIRGPRNTVVRLEILPGNMSPDSATRIVVLTRDRINLEQRAAFGYTISDATLQAKVGVIGLPSFYVDFNAQAKGLKDYRSTTRDVKKILAELMAEDINGLVIDLRDNGGGSLQESLSLTGLFIDSGPVVQTRDAEGRIEISTDPEPGVVYDGPLAVLVNRSSASASEIFSGAIQDYRRGIVIGEVTFGKGTVQNIIDLNRLHSTDQDLGKLKTTIAQFFRINGGSNQYYGIEPDVVFPIRTRLDYGERTLDNALPWSSVEPLDYRYADGSFDYYLQAIRDYRMRIADDEEIAQLVADIEFQQQQADRHSISIAEPTRRQQQDDIKAMREQPRREPVDPRDRKHETGAAVLALTEVDLMLEQATRILIDYAGLTGKLTSALDTDTGKPLAKKTDDLTSWQ